MPLGPELLVGILLVLVAGALVLDAGGFFSLVSPAGIFYGLFVAFVYVGTVLLEFGVSLSYAVPVETHPLALGVAVFAFALGTAVAKSLLAFDSFAETRRFADRAVTTPTNRNASRATLLLVVALVAVVALAFLRLGSPLLSDVSYGQWASSVSWTMVAITLLLPFSTLLLLTDGYARRDAWLWRAGVVALALTVAFMILTSRRYPVLDFGIWVVCLVAYLRFREYGDFLRAGVVAALVVTPFFVGIQVLRHPEPGAVENVALAGGRYVRNRIFLSQATGVNYLLSAYPGQAEYMGGRFLADQLVSILPGFDRHISLGGPLFDAVLEGDGGYMPPTMIGELYADFGPLGFVGLFVWGCLLQAVFVAFVRLPKTPLSVVTFAVTSGLLGRSLIQGFLSPVNRIKYLSLLLVPLLVLALKVPELRVTVEKRKQ